MTNEAVRVKDTQDEDAWRLGVENTLRAAKGEPLLKTTAELDAQLDAEDGDDGTGDAPKKDKEDDAMIHESALVLIDYINQTQQVASIVVPKPDTVVQ